MIDRRSSRLRRAHISAHSSAHFAPLSRRRYSHFRCVGIGLGFGVSRLSIRAEPQSRSVLPIPHKSPTTGLPPRTAPWRRSESRSPIVARKRPHPRRQGDSQAPSSRDCGRPAGRSGATAPLHVKAPASPQARHIERVRKHDSQGTRQGLQRRKSIARAPCGGHQSQIRRRPRDKIAARIAAAALRPRLLSGRSRSASDGSSQDDFAWRSRRSWRVIFFISAKAILHDYHYTTRPKRPAISEFAVSSTPKQSREHPTWPRPAFSRPFRSESSNSTIASSSRPCASIRPWMAA